MFDILLVDSSRQVCLFRLSLGRKADGVGGDPKPIQAWKEGFPLSLESQWEPGQDPEERKPRMGGSLKLLSDLERDALF